MRRILAQAGARLTERGSLLCEVGEARAALEKAFPRLPFGWCGESVFRLERRALLAHR